MLRRSQRPVGKWAGVEGEGEKPEVSQPTVRTVPEHRWNKRYL